MRVGNAKYDCAVRCVCGSLAMGLSGPTEDPSFGARRGFGAFNRAGRHWMGGGRHGGHEVVLRLGRGDVGAHWMSCGAMLGECRSVSRRMLRFCWGSMGLERFR